MTATALNNPAERLLQLIKAGKSFQKSKATSAAYDAWANLLSVPPANKSVLFRRIGLVMALPIEIKESVEQVPDTNVKLYLKWLPRAEQAFANLNFQSPWKQFIDLFDPTTIYGIEVCSDLLSKKSPQKIITEEKLKELLEEVNSLLSTIDESGLNDSVKCFILKHLLKIKNALEEYKIRGIEPIEDIIASSLGATGLRKGLYEDTQKNAFGKKFWSFMTKVTIIIAVVSEPLQIGINIVDLLNSNPKPAIEQQITAQPSVPQIEQAPSSSSSIIKV